MKKFTLVLFVTFSLSSFSSFAEETTAAVADTKVSTATASEKPATDAVPVATPSPAATETVATPPAAPVPTSDSSSQFYGKKNRLLGDFLVGPYVTALALPRPISFGLEAKYLDYFGLSAGYGYFPELKFSSVKVKITGWDLRLKFYPFKGAFFIAAAIGTQTFTGSSTQTISGIPATGNIKQDNSFIAPHVGWNWIWDCGIFMGIDLGVQLSMSRTTTFTTDVTNTTVLASAEYAALQKDITDKAELIGKTPLPLLTLIKIGYFF